MKHKIKRLYYKILCYFNRHQYKEFKCKHFRPIDGDFGPGLGCNEYMNAIGIDPFTHSLYKVPMCIRCNKEKY